MALPTTFLEELRARTPLATLVGRRVRLAKSGRNWSGCCPFHNEKTPSFYVYEDGYHCFGCGAHGDAISFVMQTEGANFPDAVARLAAEAGLEVPRPTPEAAHAEAQRAGLHEALEAAQALFATALHSPAGALALAYLRKRGLSDATIARFGLGFADDGRGLAQALARQNMPESLLVAAGLLRAPDAEDGRGARAQFFNRVMFPIADRRGRIISFGGRILGDGQPKYVNGPETAVFSKRQQLFALHLARPAVAAGRLLVVVEGYMDAIALHQAGFDGAVAPLGTALTEAQLAALWQVSPAPILCFDGDAAGRRAAMRVLDIALPLLTPAQTLRFASLGEGDDPDSLVRREGPAAFGRALDGARPFADMLFDTLAEGVGTAPEQRAGLRARLNEAASRIAERNLSGEYRDILWQKFRTQFRAAPPVRGAPRGRPGAPRPVRLPPRQMPSVQEANLQRGRILTAILLRHPELLHDVEEAYCAVDLPAPLANLRSALVHWAAMPAESGLQTSASDTTSTLDSTRLMDHLHQNGLAAEVSDILNMTGLPGGARPDAMPAEAGQDWWHFCGQMNRPLVVLQKIAAEHEVTERGDAASQRKLISLCNALDALDGREPDVTPA